MGVNDKAEATQGSIDWPTSFEQQKERAEVAEAALQALEDSLGETRHPNLAAALAAFHAERPRVVKDSDDTHYGRKYASLDAFEAVVLPVLARHGLTWMILPSQVSPEGGLAVAWQLVHGKTGERLEGTWPLVSGTPQQVGSSLTYAKRYLLSAVTGVSADDDDNGAAAEKAMPAQEVDWIGVVEQAKDADNLPELRQLYRRAGIATAPEEVREAFEAEVARLKAEEASDAH